MDSTDLRVFLAIIPAGCVLHGVAENCTTHPLHKAQNLMPPPTPPILFGQSLANQNIPQRK